MHDDRQCLHYDRFGTFKSRHHDRSWHDRKGCRACTGEAKTNISRWGRGSWKPEKGQTVFRRSLVQRTAPEGLDVCCRKQSFLVRDWHVVSIGSVVISVADHAQALNNCPVLAETIQEREKILSESRDPVTVSLSDFTQALENPYLVEAIQQLEKMLSKSRGPVMVSDSFLAQAIDILRNYQVLVEATQPLEKILPGSRDACILASKILSRLSSAEMVLLSCTTTFDKEDLSALSGWERSGNWFDGKEEKAFCLKFNSFMPGHWDPGQIIDKWATLYKVLTNRIHMWENKVCGKVWEADLVVGDVDYLSIIRKVEHQHQHRLYEVEKAAIRDRSRSVTQCDLAGMKVAVDVLQRRSKV
ncbi:hypothetical protein IFR04_006243 [Cadophora malorum]|uniref:Uncharacterized protein n=1 Tax=Cadophora malorum TaxID=108018 RepID=A0A8H7TKX4_9HELO|nr:hypothetical protein IFR04_006243 [Cadophora malorum]